MIKVLNFLILAQEVPVGLFEFGLDMLDLLLCLPAAGTLLSLLLDFCPFGVDKGLGESFGEWKLNFATRTCNIEALSRHLQPPRNLRYGRYCH